MKPTEEQMRMRELVERLRKEELPLTLMDYTKLQNFVVKVREEIEEVTEMGKRRMSRTAYYMLNERGLKLLHDWNTGALDKYL